MQQTLHLTFSNETLIVLLVAMLFISLLPNKGLVTLLARSATFGFKHGIMTTLGILLADGLFILLVILGLIIIANLSNPVFIIISYVSSVYLVWLSLKLRITKPPNPNKVSVKQAQLRTSFKLGVSQTLTDPKVFVFYLAFFPAFLNVKSLTYLDGAAIIILTIISISLPKLIYAYLADRAGAILKPSNQLKLNRITSTLLFIIALALIIKTTVNL